jgi:5-methylcytosine-specific restriction enzyme B
MKFTDFDTNKNAFHDTVKIIVDWLGFVSKRWTNITDKNKFIEQNLQPLLTGDFREPKIKSGELLWPSPALGTFLRYLGFINDSYEISPLCNLLINNLITLPEYSFVILSKQRGFLNESPKVNFLPLLCLYIQNNEYREISIEDIRTLTHLEGYNLKLDSSNQDIVRVDIIFNSVKMTGLFNEHQSKLILKENAKSIVDFIAENHLKFEIDKRVDKSDKYIYYGDTESGIFKLKELKLPKDWLYFYPNIFRNNIQSDSYFTTESFAKSCENAGLIFTHQLIQRFTASLCTKPFVICSGLSGSGKTKLAQAFVQWITESENQYKIIPVGADWTNREPLLGYPNGLEPNSYVMPDSCALQLILNASKDQNKPYFMILDEMNLSHVERYFADFLSIMESEGKIKLYSGEKRYSKYVKGEVFDESYFIPHEIEWPKNLFIIGTVNIDETTYMFSPKVLDRANVIEFRISENDMGKYLEKPRKVEMKKLFIDEDKDKAGLGASMSVGFMDIYRTKHNTNTSKEILTEFFKELQHAGAEFGYRGASEINELIGVLEFINKENTQWDEKDINKPIDFIDIAIMQKLLPKLHGSRKKLVYPLETLAGLCLVRINESQPDDQNKTKILYQQFISEKRDSAKWEIKYSISLEKIERMLKNVIENGFTSYAEA